MSSSIRLPMLLSVAGLVLMSALLQFASLAQAQQVGYGTGPTCYLKGMQCEAPASDPYEQANKPCCNQVEYECKAVAGKEGKYCVLKQDTCHPQKAMCEGAIGLPTVDSKPCCASEENECVQVPLADGVTMKLGKYCFPKCYKLNERCMGINDREYVVYRPCCNPSHECREIKGGLWGKFCVPRSGNTEEKTTAEETAKETKP